MSDKLYSTFAGKADGNFAGRTFAKISGYMVASRETLKEAGAEMKGPNSYLLPEGQEDAIIAKLDTLSVQDQAQAMKDRTPVAAADAAKMNIGDKFDFGGTVGEAPIVGIGSAFTPRSASAHDDRLEAGKEQVYVYNANAPKSAMPKPEMTAEEKAAKSEARAASVADRDANRVPVIEGSVAEGGTVTAGGNDVTVSKLGKAWALEDQEAVDALKARFPDAEVEVGSKIQFANFEAPEPAEEPAM
ncbi:hypothetical protein LCGC14_0227690 [marine sediment metagenome]|uniref:Uncharacterized protein n=1 Tax=marine sediment metagenome TaxID=412755 RepID=A0A0F9UB41_9ZZZZ